jgi:hypothetical protein
MDVAADANERNFVMKMGGGRDRHGIDALCQQRIEIFESAAPDQFDGAGAMFPQRIDDRPARPGRPASTRAWLLPITPAPTTPTRNSRPAPRFASDPDPFEFILSTPTDYSTAPRRFSSTPPQMWRMPSLPSEHVLIQRVTAQETIKTR